MRDEVLSSQWEKLLIIWQLLKYNYKDIIYIALLVMGRRTIMPKQIYDIFYNGKVEPCNCQKRV